MELQAMTLAVIAVVAFAHLLFVRKFPLRCYACGWQALVTGWQLSTGAAERTLYSHLESEHCSCGGDDHGDE
jgi:hypothetical protein